MDDTFQQLISILEESVKKNGKDYPLTLGHLLNMIRLAEKQVEDTESGPQPGDGPEW